MTITPQSALFLDRDGVINRELHLDYVKIMLYEVSDFAAAMLSVSRLTAAGIILKMRP
jgi:histidinol phosphatase-like enzyme